MSFPNEGNSQAIAASPGYVAVSRRSLDLEDYIDLARRHVSWIIAPTFAGLVVSIVVAFMLPNVYVSQAEMQIEPSQISSTIVTTTINQRLNERISQMQQKILSRTTLSTIIQDPRLNLYPEERAKKPLEDVIEEMRTRDIHIQLVQAPGSDRAATAFTISFQYSEPHKAQTVVQNLITKFEEENETTQRDAQTVLTSYVGDELNESKAKLDDFDGQITKFRVEHPGELPEQESLNIQELNSFQEQLRTVNDDLNRLTQDRAQIESKIDSLRHQRDLLDMLNSQTDLATAPPAIRQQNERLMALNKEVTDGESQLALLKQQYKESYPDVRILEKRLGAVRAERDALQKKQDEADAKPADSESVKPKATDYRRVAQETALNDQIREANLQLQINDSKKDNLIKQQADINKRINEYQQRLAATSAIEAQYKELQRQETLAADTYQSNLNKSQLAEQNNQLIQRRAGEQLQTLDPPNLPTVPSKPNRWEWVGGGLAISFVIGLALAGVQEARDTSLKNLKDVRAYTNLPVLSSIPLLENTMLVRRKRRLAYVAWAAGVIVGMLAITASLYFHSIRS